MVESIKNNFAEKFAEQVNSLFSTNDLNKKEDVQADQLNGRDLREEKNETTIKVSKVGVALILTLGVVFGVCLAVTMAPPLAPALAGAEALAAGVASAAEAFITVAPALQFLSSNVGLIGSLSTIPATAGVFFAALSKITSKLPANEAQQIPSKAEEVRGEVASSALPKEPVEGVLANPAQEEAQTEEAADEAEVEVPAVPAHKEAQSKEAADEAGVGVLATPAHEEAQTEESARESEASTVAALNKPAQNPVLDALLGSEELASSAKQTDHLSEIPEQQRRRLSGILKHLVPVTPAAADKRVEGVVLKASPMDWMM